MFTLFYAVQPEAGSALQAAADPIGLHPTRQSQQERQQALLMLVYEGICW